MNSAAEGAPDATFAKSDRRRHVRYRYSAPIYAYLGNTESVRAMTIEISESGLSAALGVELQIGDTVHLAPVGGGTVIAQVRRRIGKIYGFEFLQISAEQTSSLRATCLRLPRYPDNRLGI